MADSVVRRLPAPARRLVENLAGNDVLLYASGLAFYALVSVVPLAIVVLWLTSDIIGDARVREMANVFQHAAPQLQLGELVQRVADLGTSLGVPALITALWPASSYGAGLRRAFTRLSPRRVKEMKGLRGRGLTLLVLLPVFVLGSLAGSYAGSSLLGDDAFARAVGIALALLLGFVGTAAGVALIYRIFPPERMAWRDIAKGTLWSAASITVLSLLVTVFVTASSSLQEHFASGGIALLVVVAVWLFLANALLLVGYRIALES